MKVHALHRTVHKHTKPDYPVLLMHLKGITPAQTSTLNLYYTPLPVISSDLLSLYVELTAVRSAEWHWDRGPESDVCVCVCVCVGSDIFLL